ncbi:hypothetical protein ZHAS_00011015 [Anopheles sinensis]|uniref:Uncharacterized protein n=1 Tax=Anopheles sinensis TaxID=74873 RepID=A0A084VZ43_ANOSI|nr:hypothetical protein ZHAS_00011015 [Anopheles sinensis]
MQTVRQDDTEEGIMVLYRQTNRTVDETISADSAPAGPDARTVPRWKREPRQPPQTPSGPGVPPSRAGTEPHWVEIDGG